MNVEFTAKGVWLYMTMAHAIGLLACSMLGILFIVQNRACSLFDLLILTMKASRK